MSGVIYCLMLWEKTNAYLLVTFSVLKFLLSFVSVFQFFFKSNITYHLLISPIHGLVHLYFDTLCHQRSDMSPIFICYFFGNIADVNKFLQMFINLESNWQLRPNITNKYLQMGVWTFTFLQYSIDLAVNFTVPSLFSKSGCTFNGDNVSTPKFCKQVETLYLLIDMGVKRYFRKLWNFQRLICFKIEKCFNINPCYFSTSALKLSFP